MLDKFTKFNVLQRSCHLSLKTWENKFICIFFHNHPLKAPIQLSMPTVFSRFIVFTAVFFVIFID